MFKSLIQMFIIELLFPVVLLACILFFITFFPEHALVLVFISLLILVVVFSKILKPFTKLK